jgi:hypothetical protein
MEARDYANRTYLSAIEARGFWASPSARCIA